MKRGARPAFDTYLVELRDAAPTTTRCGLCGKFTFDGTAGQGREQFVSHLRVAHPERARTNEAVRRLLKRVGDMDGRHLGHPSAALRRAPTRSPVEDSTVPPQSAAHRGLEPPAALQSGHSVSSMSRHGGRAVTPKPNRRTLSARLPSWAITVRVEPRPGTVPRQHPH